MAFPNDFAFNFNQQTLGVLFPLKNRAGCSTIGSLILEAINFDLMSQKKEPLDLKLCKTTDDPLSFARGGKYIVVFEFQGKAAQQIADFTAAANGAHDMKIILGSIHLYHLYLDEYARYVDEPSLSSTLPPTRSAPLPPHVGG